MKESELFELFPPEYRDLILRYKSALVQILQKYQVVIFVARKAICFYKALVITGHIDKPRNCEVYSSRALTYNISKRFIGKKVIIVEDVMITGDSVKNALMSLSYNNINADLYIMARHKLELNEKDIFGHVNIIETYTEMDKEDIHQLSKHIADFIEASMCPYNIDQPIYSFRCSGELVTDFVKKHSLIDISSVQQREYGVESYVLNIPTKYLSNLLLKKNVELCKIRFLYGKYNDKEVFLAIPFVLIGEIENVELENIFANYNNEQMHQFIHNKNDKITLENQLKVLHYILSSQLMDAFIQANGINDSHRLNSNDDFVFSTNILQMASEVDTPFNFDEAIIRNDICYDYDFKHNEYLNHTFDFLYSDKMFYDNYCDSENKVIKSELLILSDLKGYLTDITGSEIDSFVFSNILDTLIDKGFIIPSIVHGINTSTIIRAYKCGEVYALNEQHFQLFSYSLYEYSKIIGNGKLHKTEFEKLCVLFFREAVNKRILKYKETSDNHDEFSICYSKFGPRVSTSRDELNASESSPLAARLITDNLVIDKETEDYYEPVEVLDKGIENRAWVQIAKSFSKKYGKLYKSLFKGEYNEILFNEVRDMYIKNYIEFLTMISIGLNSIEQLKSLLAEIRLFDSTAVNNDIRTTLTNCARILDGLRSGMWKYMCYAQDKHPLQKIYDKLESSSDTEDLCFYFEDSIFSQNTDIDKNEHIKPMLVYTGKLIFSIAYSIWFMLKKYNINWRVRGKVENLEQNYMREFFYSPLKDLRKSIDDMVKVNSTDQDIQLLSKLKLNASELIKRYNDWIAKGKKHMKKDDVGSDDMSSNRQRNEFNVDNKNGTVVFQITEDSSKPIYNNNSVNVSFESVSDELFEKLNLLLSEASESDKKAINVAIKAVEEKDENTFIKAIKLIGKSTLSILEKLMGSVVYGYLQQKGIVY